MSIRTVKLSNFKSFKTASVQLEHFNVLVGANAAGKSNFIRVFEFLRNIMNDGLENAVSMQGGVEYLTNLNIGTSEYLSIEVVSDVVAARNVRADARTRASAENYETTYRFAIKFSPRRTRGFKCDIVDDTLTQKWRFRRLVETPIGKGKKELKKAEELGEGTIVCSKSKRTATFEVDLPPTVSNLRPDIIFRPFGLLDRDKFPSEMAGKLLIELPRFFVPRSIGLLSDTATYDFDPKLPKKAVPITGRNELEQNGDNLAVVLKNILEDRERSRRLFNLLTYLLPFVSKLDIEKFAAKSLLFKSQETYTGKHYLPAFALSDGTINISALIVALYFENKSIAIIEEPERNIHPRLISRAVQMMKEASENKQIIATTHNPEVVRYAGLENLLLVSRDEHGFSQVSKPAEKEAVKVFMKNEIGIEELYVQDLLGE